MNHPDNCPWSVPGSNNHPTLVGTCYLVSHFEECPPGVTANYELIHEGTS